MHDTQNAGRRHDFSRKIQRDHLRDQDVDGNIILKCTLNQFGSRFRALFKRLRIRSSGVLFSTRKWALLLHKRRGMSWSVEKLSASQVAYAPWRLCVRNAAVSQCVSETCRPILLVSCLVFGGGEWWVDGVCSSSVRTSRRVTVCTESTPSVS